MEGQKSIQLGTIYQIYTNGINKNINTEEGTYVAFIQKH